jgi:hypothetical protein
MVRCGASNDGGGLAAQTRLRIGDAPQYGRDAVNTQGCGTANAAARRTRNRRSIGILLSSACDPKKKIVSQGVTADRGEGHSRSTLFFHKIQSALDVNEENSSHPRSGVRLLLGWFLLVATLLRGNARPAALRRETVGTRRETVGTQSVRTPVPTQERGNEKQSRDRKGAVSRSHARRGNARPAALRRETVGTQSVRTPVPTQERGNEKPTQVKDAHPSRAWVRENYE